VGNLEQTGRIHPDRYQCEPKVDVEVTKDVWMEASGVFPKPVWG